MDFQGQKFLDFLLGKLAVSVLYVVALGRPLTQSCSTFRATLGTQGQRAGWKVGWAPQI